MAARRRVLGEPCAAMSIWRLLRRRRETSNPPPALRHDKRRQPAKWPPPLRVRPVRRHRSLYQPPRVQAEAEPRWRAWLSELAPGDRGSSCSQNEQSLGSSTYSIAEPVPCYSSRLIDSMHHSSQTILSKAFSICELLSVFRRPPRVS